MDRLPTWFGKFDYITAAFLVGFCVWLGEAAIKRLLSPLPRGNFFEQVLDFLLRVMAVLFFCLLVAVVISIVVAVYRAIVGAA